MTGANVPFLPPAGEIETKQVLKRAVEANRHLAELKGTARTVPNEAILIHTLSLQEAKDSSEVENIVTTHDDLYKSALFDDYTKSPAAKEVSRYSDALREGFLLVRESGALTLNHIRRIHEVLEGNNEGFRSRPGTTVSDRATGKVIYTPPQDGATIQALLEDLETFINDDGVCDAVLLVKMAVIHHQFESIHPFYDGNGRAGRIVNILYLVLKDLLQIPVLYLSRYIIRNKPAYYGLLQSVREDGNWEPWILFMLDGVVATSLQTIAIIGKIKDAMMDYKHRIREEHPRMYSQDLINALFQYPYTRITFLQGALGVSRQTASQYLKRLAEAGFLTGHKVGRNNYYVNTPLVRICMDVPEE